MGAIPRCSPVSSSTSSSASTRTPSPHSAAWQTPAPQCMTDNNSDLSNRLFQAEQSLFEKDRRIEALENRVRELSNAGQAKNGSCISQPHYSHLQSGAPRCWPVSAQLAANEEEELTADVDAVICKSEDLLMKMSDLQESNEPERQWTALMAAHEDCKERLSQIEMIVQRRIEQLPAGDTE